MESRQQLAEKSKEQTLPLSSIYRSLKTIHAARQAKITAAETEASAQAADLATDIGASQQMSVFQADTLGGVMHSLLMHFEEVQTATTAYVEGEETHEIVASKGEHIGDFIGGLLLAAQISEIPYEGNFNFVRITVEPTATFDDVKTQYPLNNQYST